MKQQPFLSPAILFSEKIIREAGTGKLSIINSFQRFYGREFPFAAPPFFVSVVLAGLSGKIERLQLAVELINEAGTRILPPTTAEVTGGDAQTAPDESFELSFFISGCQFNAPGTYHVVFRVDEVELGRRALTVGLMPEAGAAVSPAGEVAAKNSPSPKRRDKKRA